MPEYHAKNDINRINRFDRLTLKSYSHFSINHKVCRYVGLPWCGRIITAFLQRTDIDLVFVVWRTEESHQSGKGTTQKETMYIT